jgi:citrate lyase subunit beta/citryl-CoA lyase
MERLDPDLRRTWLFGTAVDPTVHESMLQCGADVLIADLEDFTPPARRDEARRLLPASLQRWREGGRVAAVRINHLETDGTADLAAVMPARPDVVAYPMTATAEQMHALHLALEQWEASTGAPHGSTEILPVCETALGVVNVRSIVHGGTRIRCALLGAEDLAADLCAERGPDAVELEHARQRFLLECRAAAVEPIDAPYTFADAEGALREARRSRRLGYRCKSLVRPEHAVALNEALTPSRDETERATTIVAAFEAARARGEDRALVGSLWIEVPTYLNARRLLERARRLAGSGAA